VIIHKQIACEAKDDVGIKPISSYYVYQ